MNIGLIYGGLLAFGVVYALLSTFLGWLGDHDFGGLDADAGIDHQPHPISGTVLATFITGFGGAGTVTHYVYDWTLIPGLLAATVTGLALATAAFLILELIFSRTQAGSEFRSADAVGRIAEVITPIPEGGLGEIAYVMRGQRERSAARASDGTAIGKGTPVNIERMMGANAYVRPTD